ncbi:MAG TPA: response regulator transcription factor [Dyella sp.]
MKILVVDDHALFRAGLRLLLQSIQHNAEVLEASTLAEAIALATRHPDLSVCLLDLNLEGEYGLDGLSRLKQIAPDVAAVVVSAAHDPVTIHACLDVGAMSFVPKSMPPAALALAMKEVLAGNVYLPPDVLAHSGPSGTAAPVLTRRQHDVLRALGRGLPTKSIARELALSEHTVKEYISALFCALKVNNRTEAVVTATALGLWSARSAGRGQ